MTKRIYQVLGMLAMMLAAGSLAGCDSRQEEAQQALSRYQAAQIAGDVPAMRLALLALVGADDTNAEYWTELAKVQLQMGEIQGAYEAIMRAHELDRDNGPVLELLTNLTLRSGNLAQAEQYARQLELLNAASPIIPLTRGYVALRRSDFDEADRQADLLLASAPFDPDGKVLKARVLMQSDRSDEAIRLLEDQVRQQPSDEFSLRALYTMYAFFERWPEAADISVKRLEWRPKDVTVRVEAIDSMLRAGRLDMARSMTADGLREADPTTIARLLAPWQSNDKGDAMADAVLALAGEADGERRWAMARYLLVVGRADDVIALTREAATLPVGGGNVAPNALFGAALASLGDLKGGEARLNQVIAFESVSTDALRGRALLRSRQGDHKGAVEDAQKLVALSRSSAEARILMSRIHLAAGKGDEARRVLWDGFLEIPADRTMYEALRTFVLRTEGAAAAQRISREFKDQRNEQMSRTFA